MNLSDANLTQNSATPEVGSTVIIEGVAWRVTSTTTVGSPPEWFEVYLTRDADAR